MRALMTKITDNSKAASAVSYQILRDSNVYHSLVSTLKLLKDQYRALRRFEMLPASA